MCMISVGKVKETRKNGYLVDIDGKKSLFSSRLNLKTGDFVMLSGNRIVKKLEVVK